MTRVPPIVTDEMIEEWLARHPGGLDNLTPAELEDVADWFPIVSVGANDHAINAPSSLATRLRLAWNNRTKSDE